MHQSLANKFIRAFGRSLGGQVADKIVEICALVVVILLIWLKSGFSWTKLVAGRWEVITEGVWIASALVIWHAFRSAYAVSKEIEREESADVPNGQKPLRVLSRSGEKIYAGQPTVQVYSSPRTKLYGIAIFLTGLVFITSVLVWRVSKPSAPVTPQVSELSPLQTPFRIVISHLRTDWGHPYNPRTLIMAYYLLNKSPRLSPIDLWIDLRIINLQNVSATIEAWSIETGPTRDGPWLRLVHIPSSPHLSIYIVGSLKDTKSGALVFPDLADSLLKPIPSQQEAKGWALCECPAVPPCLAWYQRIKVRDTQGKEYIQVLSLSDYNSALTDNTAGIGVMPSKAPQRDMAHVDVLRPFPQNAYRAEPRSEGADAHLFESN
jgi:hypothetical protein